MSELAAGVREGILHRKVAVVSLAAGYVALVCLLLQDLALVLGLGVGLRATPRLQIGLGAVATGEEVCPRASGW